LLNVLLKTLTYVETADNNNNNNNNNNSNKYVLISFRKQWGTLKHVAL